MSILSISEQILLFVCDLGILQGILLAALVYFHSKSDKSVTTYLALHILFISLVMTLPFIMKAVTWRNSYFVQPVPLLIGPFLYLYIQSFKVKITWRKALPHFIPFFLFFFLAYWNISSLAVKYPDHISVTAEALLSPGTMTLMYARLAQLLFYFFISRNALLSYQRSIRHLFSDTSRINLHWAKTLINGYLFLIICSVVVFQLMFRYPEHFDKLLLINMAIATPYIYIATFKGISQTTLWQARPDLKKTQLQQELKEAEEIEAHKKIPERIKVQKAAANQDKIDEIVSRIVALMERDKLYQETELSVQQVAGKLELPSYQVSQAINDGMKRNFFDLVNSYRVEEVKQLLLDPKNKNYTILSVGFEAGFNSKTTFNTVFKKFTGLTPTEFRDKQN